MGLSAMSNSEFTVHEIARLQAENRKWGQDLRRAAAELVNQRLAKEITLEDYLARRQKGRDAEEQCRQRAEILEGASLGRRLPDGGGLRSVVE
jgi:hypothetical protein